MSESGTVHIHFCPGCGVVVREVFKEHKSIFNCPNCGETTDDPIKGTFSQADADRMSEVS